MYYSYSYYSFIYYSHYNIHILNCNISSFPKATVSPESLLPLGPPRSPSLQASGCGHQLRSNLALNLLAMPCDPVYYWLGSRRQSLLLSWSPNHTFGWPVHSEEKHSCCGLAFSSPVYCKQIWACSETGVQKMFLKEPIFQVGKDALMKTRLTHSRNLHSIVKKLYSNNKSFLIKNLIWRTKGT